MNTTPVEEMAGTALGYALAAEAMLHVARTVNRRSWRMNLSAMMRRALEEALDDYADVAHREDVNLEAVESRARQLLNASRMLLGVSDDPDVWTAQERAKVTRKLVRDADYLWQRSESHHAEEVQA